MTPPPKAPRYVLLPLTEVLGDIAALAELGADGIEAATAALDDLAHGRLIGKELGDRNVSGDLTGLARVKFDVAGQRPQRFRLIYRQVDASTREIVAIGVRDERAIYRLAVTRLRPRAGPETLA